VNPIYDLLRADGSIVVNKNLIFAIGLNESIIYAELVSRFSYFSDRGKLEPDGYFYNTISDLQSGTGLGEKPQQRTAIKNLEKLGLIDIDRRGMPPKRYFTILDNEEVLKDLLSKGKAKQSETLAASQLRLLGEIKDSHTAETKTLYGRANNTKSNKTKKIIQSTYINLPIDGHIFFNIYGRYYRRKFGKEHMRLTREQLNDVSGKINELISYDVDADTFEDAVAEHFNTLPKSNNGNIIAFLKATKRYFDVDTTDYGVM
jgi:hypothetical protein